MKLKTVGLFALLSLISGCSSIISKSEYPVSINSSPDGAVFSITNRSGQKVHNGTTPSVVTLKSSSGFFKGETYTIELAKDGYFSKSYAISSTIDGWYFGNILFGGIIGMLIVDPATGAMYNLPARVDVSLDTSVSSNPQDSLTIATIDTLTVEEVERLERIE